MAISFVRAIGTVAASALSASITVPPAGITSGDTILVAVYLSTSASVSLSDSAGNTYTQDVDSGLFRSQRVLIFRASDAAALSSAQTITATLNTSAVLILSAVEVAGLQASSPLDQTHAQASFGSAPSSGSTAATTTASEFLFGAIGYSHTGSDSYTHESGWTEASDASYSASTTCYLRPEYQIVSATGPYAASGADTSAPNWAAAIATYKAATPSQAAAGAAQAIALPTARAPLGAGAATVTPAVALVSAAGGLGAGARAQAPVQGTVVAAAHLADGGSASATVQCRAGASPQQSAGGHGAVTGLAMAGAAAGRRSAVGAAVAASALVRAAAALLAAAQDLVAAVFSAQAGDTKLTQPPGALRGAIWAIPVYPAAASTIVAYSAAPMSAAAYRATASAAAAYEGAVGTATAYTAAIGCTGAGAFS